MCCWGGAATWRPPDVVLCIVDASNLERNLYLVSQVLELGLPTVVALNMIDVAAERGVKIDVPRLAKRLGVPVIEVQANRHQGVEQLKVTLAAAPNRSPGCDREPAAGGISGRGGAAVGIVGNQRACGRGIDGSATNGSATNGSAAKPGRPAWPRYLVERLLLDTSGYLEQSAGNGAHGDLPTALQAARGRLAEAGCQVPGIEAMARYEWVGKILDGAISRPTERSVSLTDKLDRILTNRFWGTAVFAVLMLLVFSSIFIASKPLTDSIGKGSDWLGGRVEAIIPAGALQSLVSKGIIAGAGSVIQFLPQILILFGFIAVLEDCGYMARAAYLMDRLMVRVGLSGKSFIPLLSSFACAIPGVMATRVIENRRDRLTTILVAPLMSCSARLPVYALLIGAFIPDRNLSRRLARPARTDALRDVFGRHRHGRGRRRWC